ncbi:hypothetical protein GCK72_008756 [Caenorhabditis remanei]|uniref:Uncharacterized protein n=1 Tax=Caenorhabditis remanei TaxID=31234 RepID=A0A6A5GZK3_CAERE|nr:hypothetical protein GCK72_008756 [Caenorhabditis remanei]KAF1760507.1 hypothetical protein GCK72_008756 [Caenorhabditis remanei]
MSNHHDSTSREPLARLTGQPPFKTGKVPSGFGNRKKSQMERQQDSCSSQPDQTTPKRASDDSTKPHTSSLKDFVMESDASHTPEVVNTTRRVPKPTTPRDESKLKTPVEPPKMPDRDSVDFQTPDRQTETVANSSGFSKEQKKIPDPPTSPRRSRSPSEDTESSVQWIPTTSVAPAPAAKFILFY